MNLLPFLALSLVPQVQAFCGYYVGSSGTAITNHASQVVVARDGRRTTLTLAQDVTTSTSDFVLIVPVPEVIGEGDAREISGDALREVDLYSAPRLVAYPCPGSDYAGVVLPPPGPALWTALACSPSQDAYAVDSGHADDGEMLEDTVTIAANYVTGAYEIVILEAEEASGILGWLAAEGLSVNENAAALIQEYLDAGVYFLVARVALGQEGTAWLPPLQLSYTADSFSLPIRLGAQNGLAEQEMVVYTLTSSRAGTVGISNYREVDLEDECLYRGDEDFGNFYDRQLSEAFDGRAAWLREYSWSGGKCDPCTGPVLSSGTVRALGYDGTDYTLTRLRMRYEPTAVDQDVVFYTQGYASTEQVRYVSYEDGLTHDYPVCDVGWAPVDGAECYGYDDGVSTCCAGGLALGLGVPFGLLLRARRRG